MDDILIPDIPEPIVGYRAWNLESGVLRSPINLRGQTTHWPADGPYEAVCGHCTEPSPQPRKECRSVMGSGCGIYAYNEPALLRASQSFNMVYGEVWLWGRVFEHARGFRAQYAAPKCLYQLKDNAMNVRYPYAPWGRIRRAAERYGAEAIAVDASLFTGPVSNLNHWTGWTAPPGATDDDLRRVQIEKVKKAHGL